MNSVTELKHDFYQWCGLLSVDEILENQDLIRVIERLQRMFLAIEA